MRRRPGDGAPHAQRQRSHWFHMARVEADPRAGRGDVRVDPRDARGDVRVDPRAARGDVRVDPRAGPGDVRVNPRAVPGDVRVDPRAISVLVLGCIEANFTYTIPKIYNSD